HNTYYAHFVPTVPFSRIQTGSLAGQANYAVRAGLCNVKVDSTVVRIAPGSRIVPIIGQGMS
ncbi:MAG: hypothetical protein QOI13_2382, partial [Paraburkholderia sp.]|nr:hypothetical protein [Paraburkholderia sp.]